MYRRALSLGDAIHRLAHRTWFSFLKERRPATEAPDDVVTI
jgi:hypothetical protein